MSPLFFGQRDGTVHDNTYLPDHFLRHIAAIMPAHLSMDEFVASCRRPLRRSIRVNTLKIAVSDFVEKMQPQGWLVRSRALVRDRLLAEPHR